VLQARWARAGIEVVDAEPGPLAPGWVRLRVAACGICGSDLHRWRGEMVPEPGSVPGHEMVGWLETRAAGLEPGLYAVEPRWRCGTCPLCRAGKPHLCREGGIFGVHAPGGLAQWLDVPSYALHALPRDLDPVVASLVEPLAVAVRGAERARISSGERALVLGAGSVGLLCGWVARERRARVAISARHPEQRAAAARLGLEILDEASVREWAALAQPDAVIETVGGTADTLETALEACAPAGRVVVLGLFSAPARIDALALMAKEIELVGSNTYGHEHGSDFARAIDLLARHAGELAPLQTHRFPLREIEAAFRTAADKRSGALKVVLRVGL
jgi:threonine dehydrogenase-like Zn-dependent dehydrogenase